jgi:large subunit ribosomal protein L9
MQVILKQDIARVGRQYDVVDVTNGYANNFLFPQGLAEPATKDKVLLLEKKREAIKVAEEARAKALAEKFETLEGKSVTITVKADDNGSLYKKLQSSDIAEVLLSEHDIELSESSILLDTPISATGEHEVNIEALDKKAAITVHVVKE